MDSKILSKTYMPVIVPQKFPKGQKFVRSIPLNWIQSAANAGGKCINVGLSIWYLQGLSGNGNRFEFIRLAPSVVRAFGVKRNALYSSLKKLEKIKLLEVERAVGRSAKVKLIVREMQEIKNGVQ